MDDLDDERGLDESLDGRLGARAAWMDRAAHVYRTNHVRLREGLDDALRRLRLLIGGEHG